MIRALAGGLLLSWMAASMADADGRHDSDIDRGRARDLYRPVHVYDGRGQRVGEIGSWLNENGAVLNINGMTVVVPFWYSPDSTSALTTYHWADEGTLLFTSTDCSGGPIVDKYHGPWPFIISESPGGVTTLYLAKDVKRTSLRVQSILHPFQGGCIPEGANYEVEGYPTSFTYVLTNAHPNPLTLGR